MAALLMLATFSACEADDKIVFVTGTTTKPILPTVITTSPTQITENSAVSGGNVTRGASVTESGIVYSTMPNPTTSDKRVWGRGDGIGLFTCNLTGLQPNTTYYIRAYAVNESGTAYGEEFSFTTEKYVSVSEPTGTVNGYGYVDLGLSVKWATCNVGASKPEEYGNYFAWGETTTKSTYDWSTYKYCDGNYNSLNKYNTDSSIGPTDNNTILHMDDDAARVNWGGYWRMPTDAEFTELREQCIWTWTTHNGVEGYKVTSKKSGYTNNAIFLPAAGHCFGSLLDNAGSRGYYWSSSLSTGNPGSAWYVYFGSGNVGRDDILGRNGGRSVRPVLGEYVAETNIPVVVTSSISQITETTAVAGGNVTSDGGASVTERGVVYSTNPNPVITNLSNTIRPCGSGTGEFTYNITDLQPNTTYYLRAYAKNDAGTAYGEEVNFTTEDIAISEPTGIENGYGYVDLGLSVKWAIMNVGASKPEGYGDCFAWGEVTAKTTYDWSTYKWCNGSYDNLTRYNNSSVYGTVDNKTQLAFSDDAAFKNWGGSWRMPTDAEWTELREQCTWIWTTESGVYGYKVISKTNSNSIFLSAAGYYYDSSLFSANDGYYWSSSLSTDYPGYAWGVSFSSSNVNRRSSNRYCGQSVRPVCP
ncbi:MAG: hypothetical protein IKB46_06115 [Paludibacteraceae bacterium]|nr:hypothetical protein [Paludibacteraceae bacterium]